MAGNKTMKKILNIISDIIFVIIIISVLAFSLMFALNQDPEKDIFGYRVYNVLSGSMEPELSIGDLTIVKVTAGENVKNGDIITYYPTDNSGTTVTHRVINTMTQNGQFIVQTKGDAVDQADNPITADAVIGVVTFSIPFVGGIIGWIQKNIIISFVIEAVIIIGFIVISIMSSKKKKNEVNADSVNE